MSHQERLFPQPSPPHTEGCLLPSEDKPLSEYLSLDTVQAPEPEDLASAQLHLRVVNLVQPLCVLGDLLFGGAVPSLLQELQGLGRYRGDDLRTGAVEGRYQNPGERAVTQLTRSGPHVGHSLPHQAPGRWGGGWRGSGRGTNPARQALLKASQWQALRKVFCVCGHTKENLHLRVSLAAICLVNYILGSPSVSVAPFHFARKGKEL